MLIYDNISLTSQNEKYFIQSQNTHFGFNNFSPKDVPLCENVEKRDRAIQVTRDDIIWRLCIACWKTEATETHSEGITLRVFLFHCNKVRRKHLSFTFLRTFLLSCYN